MKDCDKKDWKPCGRHGCDQCHSYLLHESTQELNVSTVYKSDMMTDCSSVFMVQMIEAIGQGDKRWPKVAAWDSGANLNLL